MRSLKAVATTKKKHVQQQQKREKKKKRADDDDNVAGDGRYDDIARKHQQLLQCQYCSSMLPHIPPLLEHQSSELEDSEYVLSVFVSLFISLCLCLSSSLASTSPQLHLLARARAQFFAVTTERGDNWDVGVCVVVATTFLCNDDDDAVFIHPRRMDENRRRRRKPKPKGRQAGQGRQMKLSCYLPTNY
jgi:hypothetical protein